MHGTRFGVLELLSAAAQEHPLLRGLSDAAEPDRTLGF
jgi:hypothetical protein